MRQPQFLGEQIQYPVILLRMLARQRQMLGRRLQRMQMPLARQPRRLRARIPPRDLQQLRAQRVQPQSALGRDAQLARPGGKAVDNRSTLLNTFSIGCAAAGGR